MTMQEDESGMLDIPAVIHGNSLTEKGYAKDYAGGDIRQSEY